MTIKRSQPLTINILNKNRKDIYLNCDIWGKTRKENDVSCLKIQYKIKSKSIFTKDCKQRSKRNWISNKSSNNEIKIYTPKRSVEK